MQAARLTHSSPAILARVAGVARAYLVRVSNRGDHAMTYKQLAEFARAALNDKTLSLEDARNVLLHIAQQCEKRTPKR